MQQRKKQVRVSPQQQQHRKAVAKVEKARLAAELKGHHIVCKECSGLIDTVQLFAKENNIHNEREFKEIMKNAVTALSETNGALAKAKRLTGWKRDDFMKKIPGMLIKLRKDILVMAQWLRVHKRRLAIKTAEETDKRNNLEHDRLVEQINSKNKKGNTINNRRHHKRYISHHSINNNVNNNSLDDEEVVDEKARLFGSVSPISTPSTPGQHNFTAHSTPDYSKHQVPDHSQNHFDDFFSSIKDHSNNTNSETYQYDVDELTTLQLPKSVPNYDNDVPKTLMLTQEHITKYYATPEPPKPKQGSNGLHQFTNSPRLKHHYKHPLGVDMTRKTKRALTVRCPLCTLQIPCEHFTSVEKIPLKLLHKAKQDHSMMKDRHYTHDIQATIILCSSGPKGTHLLKYVDNHLTFLRRCLVFAFVEGALSQLLAVKLPHCIDMTYEQIVKSITTSKPNLVISFRGTSINNKGLSVNTARNVYQMDEIVRLAERHNTPFAGNESSASIMIQHIASSWDQT
eukprot:g7766.t1